MTYLIILSVYLILNSFLVGFYMADSGAFDSVKERFWLCLMLFLFGMAIYVFKVPLRYLIDNYKNSWTRFYLNLWVGFYDDLSKEKLRWYNKLAGKDINTKLYKQIQIINKRNKYTYNNGLR